MKVVKTMLLVAVFGFVGYWAVKVIYYFIMAMSLGILWVLI
jgi:hypothetical protein